MQAGERSRPVALRYLDDGARGAGLRVGVGLGEGAVELGGVVGAVGAGAVGGKLRGVYLSIFTTTGRLLRPFMAVRAKLVHCPTVCGRLTVARSIM